MNEKSYNIKFVAIDVISKSLHEPGKELTEKQDFTFNFLVDLKVNQEQKMAAVITDVTILRVKDNFKAAYFKLLCVFEFPDFDQIFKKIEEKRYDTPIELEILLKSTGISTIRGVIYSELKGTYLHNAVMPLIDMASLVKAQRQK